MAWPVLVFLLLPTVLVVILSFDPRNYISFPPRRLDMRWYEEFLSDSEWMYALLFSLRLAVETTICSVVLGLLAAIGLVRGRLRINGVIYGLMITPLIVPHIVTAVALYIGYADLSFMRGEAGLLVAHTILTVPYVVLIMTGALVKIDPKLEMAALSLGASPVGAFRLIALPQLIPSILGAGLFAFVTSFDETTVSFFLSDIHAKTITRKMFEDIDFNLSPIIAVASTIMIAISISTMLVGKSLERLARL